MRQRRKRPALILKFGLVRLPICEALAFHAPDRGEGAVNITIAKPDAVIVAEIKFGQITMQVLFFTVLIDAFHAALEDRERALNRVGMNDVRLAGRNGTCQ